MTVYDSEVIKKKIDAFGQKIINGNYVNKNINEEEKIIDEYFYLIELEIAKLKKTGPEFCKSLDKYEKYFQMVSNLANFDIPLIVKLAKKNLPLF